MFTPAITDNKIVKVPPPPQVVVTIPNYPPQPEILDGSCQFSKAIGYIAGGTLIFAGVAIDLATEVGPIFYNNSSTQGEIIVRVVGGLTGTALVVMGAVSIYLNYRKEG